MCEPHREGRLGSVNQRAGKGHDNFSFDASFVLLGFLTSLINIGLLPYLDVRIIQITLKRVHMCNDLN